MLPPGTECQTQLNCRKPSRCPLRNGELLGVGSKTPKTSGSEVLEAECSEKKTVFFIFSHKNLYINVCSCFIQKAKKLETIQKTNCGISIP